MAQNRWVTKWGYGYSGTESADVVFLTDELGATAEEVEKLTDAEAEEALGELVWERAIEQVEAYCRPARDEEVDWHTVSQTD